jgi:DNA-binding Lrp family transcriptional regulator
MEKQSQVEKIKELLATEGRISTSQVAEMLLVSRQRAQLLLRTLVAEGLLRKIGTTRGSTYVYVGTEMEYPEHAPHHYSLTFARRGESEDRILKKIEENFLILKKLPENILRIFRFSFLEMLNNALEHSTSNIIRVVVGVTDTHLYFTVKDAGVGVFRKVANFRNLATSHEAAQDLLKGKTTTDPTAHTGQGIFFVSKLADHFKLQSFELELFVDNVVNDVFLHKSLRSVSGTSAIFEVALDSKRETREVFERFTNLTEDSNHGFDGTEVKVHLYQIGGYFLSRTEARRILSGLEKFRVVTLDFDRVPAVGQGFADEIFRVFHSSFPKVKIIPINMNEEVAFMVTRAIADR